VRPRLLLTFGLRWEINMPLSEKDNLGANFFPDRGLVTLGRALAAFITKIRGISVLAWVLPGTFLGMGRRRCAGAIL